MYILSEKLLGKDTHFGLLLISHEHRKLTLLAQVINLPAKTPQI